MRSFSLILLAATAAPTEHCGPTPREVGEAVLVVQPLVFVVGLAVVALLLWLWRSAPKRPIQTGPIIACFALTLLGAGLTRARGGGTRYLLGALTIYGASHLTILLLATRVFLARKRERTFAYAGVVPLLVFMPVALSLAFEILPSRLAQHAEDFFVYPGGYGFVSAGVFTMLVIEALARRAKEARGSR